MSLISDIVGGVEAAAMIAMPELGAMSLLEQAAGSAITQMAGQMFSGALSQLNTSGNLSSAMNSFSSGFSSMANFLGAGSGSSSLSQQVLDAAFGAGMATGLNQGMDAMAQLLKNAQANQSNASQAAAGGGSSGSNLASQILANGEAGQQATSASPDSAKGKSGNWLEALAQAMGTALGGMASKLVSESNTLQSLSSNAGSGTQAADQFEQAESQFQADSQLFGILSNAFATAIKSIGDGMSTLAQKG
jgi:hypothetical protein